LFWLNTSVIVKPAPRSGKSNLCEKLRPSEGFPKMGSFFGCRFLTTLFSLHKLLIVSYLKRSFEKSKMGSFGKNALS
jgi:hypothetical protein